MGLGNDRFESSTGRVVDNFGQVMADVVGGVALQVGGSANGKWWRRRSLKGKLFFEKQWFH